MRIERSRTFFLRFPVNKGQAPSQQNVETLRTEILQNLYRTFLTCIWYGKPSGQKTGVPWYLPKPISITHPKDKEKDAEITGLYIKRLMPGLGVVEQITSTQYPHGLRYEIVNAKDCWFPVSELFAMVHFHVDILSEEKERDHDHDLEPTVANQSGQQQNHPSDDESDNKIKVTIQWKEEFEPSTVGYILFQGQMVVWIVRFMIDLFIRVMISQMTQHPSKTKLS